MIRVIRRLLLWDIDGTLLRAGPVGMGAFELAVADVVGRVPDERPATGGRTDPQIVRDYLRRLGVTTDVDGIVVAVLRRLEVRLAAMADQMAVEGSVCAGAAEALTRLGADRRILCGVLTGNIAPNAVVKLAAFGLDRLLDLDVGAFGSDDDDRNALVPVAMVRAAEAREVRLEPEDVWVIGDTPLDLACARAAGARCLLVASGHTPFSELGALGADAVLEDLRDTEAVVKLLTADL